jgi:outer membrane protein assembly factor BamB
LLIGGEDGVLRALSTDDGSPIWQQDLGASIRDAPVVESRHVIAGTSAGDVVACDIDTGQHAWRYSTGAPGAGGVTAADGIAYVGDALGRVHALDVHSGRAVWREPCGARKRIGAAPAVSRGLVIVGSYDGSLYGIDKQSGELVWERPLGDRITASSVIGENWIFASTYGGRIVKLDLFAGRPHQRWRFTPGSPLLSDLVLSEDGKTIYAGAADGSLCAIDRGTAEVLYRFEASGPVAAAPAEWGGLVFVGTGDGHVHALDAAKSEVLWRFEAGSPLMGLQTVDGAVYVATRDGDLMALSWHLGQWGRMARYAENAGRHEEAAVFYALAGQPLRARRLFHRIGDFMAAAQVLGACGERTEAAEDYWRAAEGAQGQGRSKEAAELYELAADLFAEIHGGGEARACRDAAIRCRQAPFLHVEVLNQPELVVGERAMLQARLTNTGYSKARNISVKLSGPCECLYEFRSPELGKGRACQFTLENLVPTRAGRKMLFRLLIHYRTPEGRSYDYQLPVRFSVRAPEQPPIRVEELLVVQGPMTRIKGSAGVVRQRGETGVIEVEDDVGLLEQGSRPSLLNSEGR